MTMARKDSEGRALGITRDFIQNSEWLLDRLDSHDIIGLHEDGSISGTRFSHVEHRWELTNGELKIFDIHDRLIYSLVPAEADGPRSFAGHYFHRGEKRGCTLTLRRDRRPKTHYRERGWDRLLTEQRLGASRDFLLVTFNSLGKPYSGVLADWEMYHLPNELSVDYLRFSASALPRSWYLDKVEVIMAQLRAVIAIGYQRIAMVGMSAGGYASILFAELLSAEFPDVEVSSVVFNPTLLVSDRHYETLVEFPESLRSTLCTPENYARRQVPMGDIPDVLDSASRACHTIHYDALNPFEKFQIDFLPNSERLTVVAHDLKLSHGAGTQAIYRSGIIQAHLRTLMPDGLFPDPASVVVRNV